MKPGSRKDLSWILPDPALERPGDLDALKKSLEPLAPKQALEHARGPVAAALDVLDESGIPFLEAWASARSGRAVSPRRRSLSL